MIHVGSNHLNCHKYAKSIFKNNGPPRVWLDTFVHTHTLLTLHKHARTHTHTHTYTHTHTHYPHTCCSVSLAWVSCSCSCLSSLPRLSLPASVCSLAWASFCACSSFASLISLTLSLNLATSVLCSPHWVWEEERGRVAGKEMLQTKISSL